MLRHVLLAVVIAIVVWMGYSVAANRGFWSMWRHHPPATGQSGPGAAHPATPTPTPATPVAMPASQ
jgi:hypothetical protein